MKIAISGTRKDIGTEFFLKFVIKALNQWFTDWSWSDFEFQLGCCKTGVDSVARSVFKKYSINHRIHYADWKKSGKRAGPIRNREMMADAEFLIAFPIKSSTGTKDCMKVCKRQKKTMLCKFADGEVQRFKKEKLLKSFKVP